ncbi:hypothetical protein VIGAN_11106200 [Vigna angularis var. angularis]|uniref:Uncharacterized protein n=1 Tax=Vigna angularis var. angularis TaxID=157739 RepID=A0A0S3TA27_PHAAN|nr:hypothetical protein VIGAN_11106200 [Vigna angularis var. angularis]
MEVDASFTKCKQRDGSTNEGIIDDTNDATTMEVAAMNAGGDDPRQRSDKGSEISFLLLRLDSFLNERPNFGAAPGVLGKPNRVFSFALPRGGFVPLLGKEAWETVWLPEDLTPKMRAPWESDVNFPSSSSSPAAAIDAVAEADKETKAFVAKMNENWNEQRRGSKEKEKREENGALWRI